MMIASQLWEQAAAFGKTIAAVDVKPRVCQLEIDGLMYTSTKLPASIGLELWPRVVVLLGSAMTRAVATGEDVDEAQAQAMGAHVVTRVADRAMRDGLVPLVRDLLQRMKCNNLQGSGRAGPVLESFDEHFAGEYGHLAKVCAFALAHNLRGPTLGAL